MKKYIINTFYINIVLHLYHFKMSKISNLISLEFANDMFDNFLDFDDKSDIEPVNNHYSLTTKKKYNSQEEIMFIKCIHFGNKYKIIFEDGYSAIVNKLLDREHEYKDNIDLDDVKKEVNFYYLHNRFVSQIIIHHDAHIYLPGEELIPTYTLYVYYFSSKITIIKGEYIRKEHKWIFRFEDKMLIVKDIPGHQYLCDEIVHTILKDNLKHWFSDREYYDFGINYDAHICNPGEEMPETYTITARYID